MEFSKIGSPLDDLETPCLLVDLDKLETNLQRMKDFLSAHPAVKIRPHAKAHKSFHLAQLSFFGPMAVGVCCQTVSEVEAMEYGGISNILFTNETMSPSKVARLVQVHQKQGMTLAVCVDSFEQIELFEKELKKQQATKKLRILVEFNMGIRCGVDTPEEVGQLAQRIQASETLEFEGLQAYLGSIQHVRSFEERQKASAVVHQKTSAVVQLLKNAGIPCRTVSGSGTGTVAFDAPSGVYTEVQCGSFVFMDLDYSRNLTQQAGDQSVPTWSEAGVWEQSLFVLTQVIRRSVSPSSRRIVLDAGQKAASVDSGLPKLAHVSGVQEYRNGGDEHLIALFDSSVDSSHIPALGAKLKLIPGHCDPTVAMHNVMYAVRDGKVKDIWPIATHRS